MSNSKAYIDQLTWLRGFAAFLVIISHTVRATEVVYYEGDKAIAHGIFSALDLGTFGVLLFFALSGCTLYISNAEKLTTSAIPGFYIKRFFRIWPAFAVSILCYLGFRLIFQSYYHYEAGHWIEGQFLDEVSNIDILGQAFLVSNFTGATLVNNAYWSLPVEFQYYLVFPVLILSTRLVGSTGPIILGVILYFLPKVIPVSSSQVFVLALSFCGGVSIGYLYKRFQYKLNAIVGFFMLISGFVVVSLQQLAWFALPDIKFISNVWNFYSLVAVILVFVVLHTSFTVPAIIGKFLKHYGEISYSAYLYHNLVIAVLMLLFLNFMIEGQARFYLLLIFTLCFTQLLAHYSHRYIELPTMKFGRRF